MQQRWISPKDAVICRKKGVPYIIAPRGSFDEWSMHQKWLKKQIALWVYQRADTIKALAMHATCETEADCCRKYGKCKRVIISPNGINFPIELPTWTRHADGLRKVLFLSRIHPKKGLLELVRAWAQVHQEGWALEIVGNDSENYWHVVQDEINRLHVSESVIRTDFLSDDEKWKKYRSADCFVLPTHTENFGIVIAEALYAGLPVITTKGAPWKGLLTHRCGWWTEIGVEPVAAALRDMMVLNDTDRESMGARGHEFARTAFDWRMIAMQLVDQYEKLLYA